MKKVTILFLSFIFLFSGCFKKEKIITQEDVVMNYLNFCYNKSEDNHCYRFNYIDLKKIEKEIVLNKDTFVFNPTYYVHLRIGRRIEVFEIEFENGKIVCIDKKGNTIYYEYKRG